MTMNIARRLPDGSQHQEEPLNQSQIYITTAGFKGTYAYEKLIQTLVQSIVEPEKAFIMGGTYRVPVAAGLFSKTFISDLKRDGLFQEAAFGREYESQWTGTVEDAFFDSEKFDRSRVFNTPEYKASGRAGKLAYYIISVDVGRKGCESVACVFKVTPQTTGRAIKALVNMYSYSDMHFEDQAIQIKKLYYAYEAKRLVIDGNGMGIGFIDYMIKPQIDTDGNVYPDFGVYNDKDDYYKCYRTDQTELDAIYIIKAHASENTEAYTAVQTALNSGKLKFLIDDKVAKQKLMNTVRGQKLTPEQRDEELRPFIYTSMLKEQMLNLREETEGINIILKQVNKRIPKDKFSSLCYGIYYIKQEEDQKQRRKQRNLSAYFFMN